ncbi:hypothetical protein Acsp01_85960 [Actinoplanes sp. NBRC 101535]|nr:hypothetical protein Acsp01_85960 [Actinoplanes sp. NBRC 101535]
MPAPSVEVLVRWEAFRAGMRRRRVERGLTQVALAARMGRSQDFVSYLESNSRSVPEMATVMLWADALGGQPGVVFPGEQEAVTC